MHTIDVETDDYAYEHSFLNGLSKGKYSRSELVFIIQIYMVRIFSKILVNFKG